MKPPVSNLLVPPNPHPTEEQFDPIIAANGLLIERIVSVGHASPEGFWYNQSRDEWVVVLAGWGTVAFDDGRVVRLEAGDHLHIPAGTRHRVEATSANPPCLWLAVHWDVVQSQV